MSHLEVKHGREMRRERRHDPDPVARAATAQFVLILVVLHERLTRRMVICYGYVLFLVEIQFYLFSLCH